MLKRKLGIGALLSAVAVVVVTLVFTATAVGLTDYTWSGSDTAGDTWSDSLNWDGGVAPTGSVGTLNFPADPGGDCWVASPPQVCFSGHDDVSGLNTQGISINDNNGYNISGTSPLTLGSGGIDATAVADPPYTEEYPYIALPITLSASQTWSIAGDQTGDPGQISYDGAVTGSSDDLNFDIASTGQLSFQDGTDFEVGPLDVNGPGELYLFYATLNGTDGQTVVLEPQSLTLVDTSATFGALDAQGVLELIEPDYPSAATVSGDATLADTADLELSINEPVADPDQDASELSASGTINIAGATLSLSQTGAPNTNLCQALDPGDVYTLLSSTGTLTGTFAGVPDGSTVALPADCTDSTTPADVEINYTAHAVTATVLGLVPQNLSSPTIGGTLQSGQTLTAGAGSWSGNPSSYGYQWETCSGSSCTPITGATAPSYQLGSNDVGSGILLAVTATNASGTSTPAYSRISVPVESSPATASATPPLNSSVPTISGLSRVGDTLTATSGSWTGSGPMTYTYQWQRCESSCANIPGAVTAEYKLASADAGARVDVVVTATNGAGSATASSQQLGPVTQPGPTTAEIKSALSKVLVPTGRAAAIGYLLKAGGYSFTFPAPSGGALKLTWRSGSGARAVVVGTATLELHGSGKAKFKLELTAKGRHLLAHSNSLQIQATASFAPTGQSAVSDNADFRLKR